MRTVDRVSHRVAAVRQRVGAGRRIPLSWTIGKRLIDLLVAVTAIAATLPIVLVAIVGIVLVSNGSPLLAQERVGKNGARFKMYKLRTMVNGAHQMREDLMHLNEVSGPVFKIKRDPRLHAMGGFLRRTSIDELPNFWNVLSGDMSIVGPRPPLPCEVEHYDAVAMRRLSVNPGITCYWQISGRSNISFQEWMRLDNHYIDNWSPVEDLRIILKTVPSVFLKDGAH